MRMVDENAGGAVLREGTGEGTRSSGGTHTPASSGGTRGPATRQLYVGPVPTRQWQVAEDMKQQEKQAVQQRQKAKQAVERKQEKQAVQQRDGFPHITTPSQHTQQTSSQPPQPTMPPTDTSTGLRSTLRSNATGKSLAAELSPRFQSDADLRSNADTCLAAELFSQKGFQSDADGFFSAMEVIMDSWSGSLPPTSGTTQEPRSHGDVSCKTVEMVEKEKVEKQKSPDAVTLQTTGWAGGVRVPATAAATAAAVLPRDVQEDSWETFFASEDCTSWSGGVPGPGVPGAPMLQHVSPTDHGLCGPCASNGVQQPCTPKNGSVVVDAQVVTTQHR